MKVFFAASFYARIKYPKNYDLILANIELQDVEVVTVEKANFKNALSLRDKKLLGDEKKIYYESVRRGILYSDTVILEMSLEDFQLGHEVTLAIQNKKQVLCLSIFEDYSEKISDPYFHGAKYTESVLEGTIEDFLSMAKKDLYTERFNGFFSKSQFTYLQKTSEDFGMNMSEYLRYLIDKQTHD